MLGAHFEEEVKSSAGSVPCLRRSARLFPFPALTRWAKLCRAYGTGFAPGTSLASLHDSPAPQIVAPCVYFSTVAAPRSAGRTASRENRASAL